MTIVNCCHSPSVDIYIFIGKIVFVFSKDVLHYISSTFFNFLSLTSWRGRLENSKTLHLKTLIVDIDKNSWSGHPYSCHIIIKRKIHLAICLLYHKNKFLFRCWSPKILWSPVIARIKMSLGNELSVCQFLGKKWVENPWKSNFKTQHVIFRYRNTFVFVKL